MAMEGIYAFADQIKVYKAILDSTQEIQDWLRYHSGKCGARDSTMLMKLLESSFKTSIHWQSYFFSSSGCHQERVRQGPIWYWSRGQRNHHQALEEIRRHLRLRFGRESPTQQGLRWGWILCYFWSNWRQLGHRLQLFCGLNFRHLELQRYQWRDRQIARRCCTRCLWNQDHN